LADLGVESEICDQLAAGQEPVGVPDRGDEGRGADEVHARHGHQPPDLRPGQRLLGDQPLDRRDLRIEELDLADASVDRLALLQRQLQPGQPRAALDPEQVRARRPLLQPALKRA
jgi:hypothetical protein